MSSMMGITGGGFNMNNALFRRPEEKEEKEEEIGARSLLLSLPAVLHRKAKRKIKKKLSGLMERYTDGGRERAEGLGRKEEEEEEVLYAGEEGEPNRDMVYQTYQVAFYNFGLFGERLQPFDRVGGNLFELEERKDSLTDVDQLQMGTVEEEGSTESSQEGSEVAGMRRRKLTAREISAMMGCSSLSLEEEGSDLAVEEEEEEEEMVERGRQPATEGLAWCRAGPSGSQGGLPSLLTASSMRTLTCRKRKRRRRTVSRLV